MASNFFNSSGTDLDNLFQITNSNAGTLGYVCSNGEDLGNRYPTGSLGTTIGYYSSAGTDIGYIRTKEVAPTGTVSLTVSNYSKTTVGDHHSGREDSCSAYQGVVSGCLNISIDITNGMPVTGIRYHLEMPVSAYISPPVLSVNIDSTIRPSVRINCSGGDSNSSKCSCNRYYSWGSSSISVPKVTSGTKWSRSSSFITTTKLNLSVGYMHTGNYRSHTDIASYKGRIAVYVYNNSGGTWLISNDQIIT